MITGTIDKSRYDISKLKSLYGMSLEMMYSIIFVTLILQELSLDSKLMYRKISI